jgi:halocyanin-like protein
MTDASTDVSRRRFLQTAAGATAATAATGTAAGAEAEGGDGGGGGGGGQPDFGNWFDNVGNYDGSVVDARGESEVTIGVGTAGNGGNLAFDPPAVHVDTGTTVVWEWTGEGGSHNVVEQEGAFESDLSAEEGFTYEQTLSESGIVNYYCNPHRGQGMKGSVVVGDDYPTVSTGGSGGPERLPNVAKATGVAVTFVMAATLGLAYFFMKYGGDYGDV